MSVEHCKIESLECNLADFQPCPIMTALSKSDLIGSWTNALLTAAEQAHTQLIMMVLIVFSYSTRLWLYQKLI